VHAEGAPHCPLVLHVATPLPAHCVAPAAHTPTQVPATHVESTHTIGGPHLLSDVQISTALPEHWRVPCVHAPAHAPATHVPMHGEATPQ
jgi:hypothetical protein